MLHNPKCQTERYTWYLQWLQQTEFDANDPDNANLIELQKLIGSNHMALKREDWPQAANQEAVYFKPPGRAVVDRLVYTKRRWKAAVAPQGAMIKLSSRATPAGPSWSDSGQQLVMALRIWMRRLCDREELMHGMYGELIAAPIPKCASSPHKTYS